MGPKSHCALHFHGSFLKIQALALPPQNCSGQDLICILRGAQVIVTGRQWFQRQRFSSIPSSARLSSVRVQQHKGTFPSPATKCPLSFSPLREPDQNGAFPSVLPGQGTTVSPGNVSEMHILGLPWWRSGWGSACQCRGHGFEPWSGKIPHAAEWLGLWATTTEPARLEPVLRNKRGRDSERPAHRDEEWPPLTATREKALAQKQGPNTAKN